eukprot:Gb_09311 [translate_table: standard]
MKRGRKVESEPKTRHIEVRIISAEDLEDVKRFGKMRTYAVAFIDPDHKATTNIDEEGGINPTWNQKLVLQADDELLSQTLAAINVDIYAHGHIREKLVGTARILISEVLKGGNPADPSDNPIQCIAVQVRRPSGRPQGILNLWVPPTGRFLLHRASLSMNRTDSVKILEDDDVAEESVADVTVE